MTTLSRAARQIIKNTASWPVGLGEKPAFTIRSYVRWATGGDEWRGDRCGCTDDRCAGYHHDQDEECGCLPVLLEQYQHAQTGSA